MKCYSDFMQGFIDPTDIKLKVIKRFIRIAVFQFGISYRKESDNHRSLHRKLRGDFVVWRSPRNRAACKSENKQKP